MNTMPLPPVLRCLSRAWWLVLCLWLAGCALDEQRDEARYIAVADEIRQHYERILPDLPADDRRHYAQRLYRLTGEARYLPPNRDYADRLLDELKEELPGLARPEIIAARAEAAVTDYPERTDKQRRRKRMLADWREIAYAKGLAFRMTQASYLGLLNETDLPGYRRALRYLEGIDFRAFVTDPEVMEVYAAQVANLAYYLHELEVADLREASIEAFRRHYPPERDASLSRASYRNKIYGMTHFVIAASGYYQWPVPPDEFDWILDYFAGHLERILVETKEDIYTEVGISFLLAGRERDPAVGRLRDALLAAYDAEARMVPAEDGGLDPAYGEHRNVLAIMLLDWPDRLYPGPDLGASP
ncbi:DUF3541 domain-containing protein [Halomonas caseinilytica]|uniref:DUF3541 domain-containing protein n=1 Tax=Halomonas caseinilytica TaxID=438744 RepID=A0A1M6VCM3_9GAMM|nr:DUF3541 domain-containing protein [Halomonas caseinilytica]SHK79242.1 protein of unknown function [Halomonas caseinilytica]